MAKNCSEIAQKKVEGLILDLEPTIPVNGTGAGEARNEREG